MARYSLLYLAFSVCLADAHVLASRREPLNFNLYKRQGAKVTGNTVLDDGFWFTNMTVGASRPLELLVDTGSADLVTNPGLYKPTAKSVNLNTTYSLTYGTATGNGAGSSSASITASLYNDTVQFGSISVASQGVGVLLSGNASTEYPHDGIVGLGDQSLSGSNATTFFHNVCEQNLVPECRFGLGLQADGTGTLTLGGISDSFQGGEQSLTKAPILQEWASYGDLAVDGKIIQKDVIIEYDSGTSGFEGPISAVEQLFNLTGIQGVLLPDNGGTLVGYFPCGKQLPTVGLSLPSQSNIANASTYLASGQGISNSSKIFNILAEAMTAGAPVDAEGKNCTSAISGSDVAQLPGLWVVGQAWFQGKYIDHNLIDGTFGVAEMSSNATGKSNSTASSTAASPTSTNVAVASAASLGMSSKSETFGLLFAVLVLLFTV